MKIGILTHQYINNYGAFLQAWALRQAIAGLFPEDEVQIIDYVNLKHFIINTGGWFRFYKNRETLKEWLQKTRLPHTFAKARRQHMVLSKRCFNAQQINALGFDCIIVGSDEVWNYKDSKGNAELKFGIGLTCKHLIAYAPSVGKVTAEETVPQYVIDGIRKFKYISARDDLTEQLAKRVTGKAPTRVLDPTFLTEFPRADARSGKKPYILFYYCDKLPEPILTQIFSYAKQHDLDVLGAGECDKRYSAITINLTPFEWIEMFKNAEFVFTGTFHGAVFSILNQRQFKVYLTNESRIKKVTALLNELGISNRVIGSDFQFDLEAMKSEINYSGIQPVIEQKRQMSKQYLKDAIGSAKK
ncbi:MAG: polysaccharide pyruvyl transferase family protein [Clostridia bacterium]|nr:polysaccharide pyruvyl transferase family protein [Clostridia bacterium]